jgi:hypothetical protein
MVEAFIYCLQLVSLLGSGLALFILLAAVPYSLGKLAGRHEFKKEIVEASLEKSLDLDLWFARERVRLVKKLLPRPLHPRNPIFYTHAGKTGV